MTGPPARPETMNKSPLPQASYASSLRLGGLTPMWLYLIRSVPAIAARIKQYAHREE